LARYSIAFICACLLLFPDPISAQNRFALDADPTCWGEVPSDPNLSPAPPWTTECWVYLEDDFGDRQTILQTVSPSDVFLLEVLDGAASVTLQWNGVDTLSAVGETPLPLGAWTHLAVTLEAGELNLFLNGHLDAVASAPITPLNAPGPLLIGSSNPANHFIGWIDQTRLSDSLYYTDDFDPFDTPLEDLRIADGEVQGWELGTGPGDLQIAWDYNSLYAIIDGGAVVYINHNFQYAVQQYYYGMISDSLVALKLWMTDQGTPEDAQALFHDPNITPFSYEAIEGIGEEARLDTGLLFDWVLDFWRDKYYVEIILSKEEDPDQALQIATAFASIADSNILNRDLFTVDEHTIALWRFDEGTGTVFHDASEHQFDGTLSAPNWQETTPYQQVVYITSAQLLDGDILNFALDEDDTARITFSAPLQPVNLHAGNIDDILQIESGDSWLSGSGELGSVTWNQTNDTLKITFSFAGGAPTLQNDDKIIPNPQRITSQEGFSAGGYRFIRFEVPAAVSSPVKKISSPVLQLYPPSPTPFNATTTIRIDLPQAAVIQLSVFDITGRIAAKLFQGRLEAGTHSFDWNAAEVSSGVYLIFLQSGADHFVEKVVLLK
jgi:hypothetical protein